MGRDRGEREIKKKAEISVKLHEEFGITKKEAFLYWENYQKNKQIYGKLNALSNNNDPIFNMYFASLAMEMMTKEILKDLQIDKKED